MELRLATRDDIDQIWTIFQAVIKTGESHIYEPETSKKDFVKIWFSDQVRTYVAQKEDEIVGTFILKPNFLGLASHVSNASYMVSPNAQRQGIGQALCDHSLNEAKRLGFHAMQFNIVISTNKAAIALWEKNGFSIIGRVPQAYHHKKLGYVDTLIMYKKFC